MTEEEVRSPVDGRLVNCGTWDYKIPSGLDIPIRLNVTLLRDASRVDASSGFLGSKSTGEPAMLVGGATFFAIKDAIYAARQETDSAHCSKTWFAMDAPASLERIQ